ncbi:hypothetical protein CVT26_003103 [Gymnopilus dilepis]|uniref:Senescence domain-containing protein n=1 Tax=Gymnopilus dilepis TaxID=231916 RepID=A0A409Y4J0_9AGAR|nr:hypothetical protein CVT26_003103 [Gymnopilus dilepis]
MFSAPEAYLLLSLPNATLTVSGSNTEMGNLSLECVSLPSPDSKDAQDRNVYLVLRMNATELPIDPATTVKSSDGPGFKTYTFQGTQIHPTDVFVKVLVSSSDAELLSKLEAFENIVEQYVAEYHGSTTTAPPTIAGQSTTVDVVPGDKDLRGHLVMINEDTGEVVGEVEDRFKIKEDPLMHEKGHEHDPVIIEVPEETTRQADANVLEAFARIVPPEQRNWITSSANVVSHAISKTTNLLLTTITAASSFYISHSTPSPYHSNAQTPVGTPSGSKGASPAPGAAPPLPPRPPRALVFLTSEKTRKGLATVHAMSGEAVKISSKTIGLIDKMIRRAMGAKSERQSRFGRGIPASGAPTPGGSASGSLSPAPVGPPPQLPPRMPSPFQTSAVPPPPYTPGNEKAPILGDQKAPIPAPAPAPFMAPPLPPRSGPNTPAPAPSHTQAPPPLPPRLKTRDHILISADLILSTIDDSLRKVLDVSSEQVGRVVQHKYGPEAAHSSMLMTGTARNVGLVYVDMRGIGRRALLRRAGKEFVKARLGSKQPGPGQGQGQEVQMKGA